MAALNFPSSPTVGQTYTANGLTYEWNGESWVTYNVLQDLTVNDSNTGDASPVTYDGFTAKTISSNTVGAIHKAASSTDNAVARFDGTTGDAVQNSVVLISDAGDTTGMGSLGFDGTNPTSPVPGTLWFDSSTNTWNAQQNAITQQVGEELFLYGKASAAITDSPLQIIYHTGTVGASGVIKFAPTIAGITDENAIVGVATESIALNDFGRITTFGIVHGITTNGAAFGETWADDDVIWYNPVTGNPTNVKPVAPNIKFQIGIVINAGSGGSGSFQVLLVPGTQLGGTDSNVTITSPTSGQSLVYNGTVWTNSNTSANLPRVVSITGAAGGTITPTGATADQYEITALGAAATFAIPSGTPTDGQKLIIRIKDDGTGRGLTWTTSAGGYRALGFTLPTTTVASKVLYIGCIYNSQDSFWDVTTAVQQS